MITPDEDGFFWLVEERAPDDSSMTSLLSYGYNEEPGECLLVFDSLTRAAAFIEKELEDLENRKTFGPVPAEGWYLRSSAPAELLRTMQSHEYACVLFNLKLYDIEEDDPTRYILADEFLKALRDL